MIKKIKTIEDLAALMQKEFLAVSQRFDRLDKDVASLKDEVVSIKYNFEDLKLKINQAAFRFEVEDLGKRLRKVEVKLGLYK